jgi:hypothetical protein
VPAFLPRVARARGAADDLLVLQQALARLRELVPICLAYALCLSSFRPPSTNISPSEKNLIGGSVWLPGDLRDATWSKSLKSTLQSQWITKVVRFADLHSSSTRKGIWPIQCSL